MSSTKPLPDRFKQLFALTARAALTNPFGEERREVDADILGAGCASRQETIEQVHKKVSEGLHALEQECGSSNVKQFNPEDREALRFSILFDTYHQFKPKLDQLIQEQLSAGDTPCPVDFAPKLLKHLSGSGFAAEEARRALAMFYQMRRAYYFIEHALVGRSASMQRMRLHLWNNIFTGNLQQYEGLLWNRMEDFSTLLLGETGTGKGAAAGAIGRSGYIPYDDRKGSFKESFVKNYLSINLSEYPETLIESELFGHRKGAFTGAIDHHDGVFSRCRPHGAIFLDEIGEVSTPTQIKLLQVLQERTFTPVGDHQARRFEGRIIAATNQDLDHRRREGKFRDDFYYRLCSDTVTVPPLRQRIQEDPSELLDLIEVLTDRILGTHDTGMIECIHSLLRKEPGLDYPWPGNVRELEQAIRRVIITGSYCGDRVPEHDDLMGRINDGIQNAGMDAQDLLAHYCTLLHQRYKTFEEVARRTKLDRRTVKKYIEKLQED